MGPAAVGLTPPAIEDCRRCQVAGAMIEELAGQGSWRHSVLRFFGRDPGGGLHHAVESPPPCPWAGVAPRIQVHHDEAGVAGGKFVRAEPKPVQAARHPGR